MKKNKNDILEKILIFSFLIIGIMIIFKINSIYLEKSKEKQNKDRQILMQELKKEQASKIPHDPNRKKREIKLEINDKKIIPEIITANLGEEVILNIKVVEGYHNLNIDYYNLKSANIATGKTEILNFIATQSGEFNIFSSTNRYNFPEPEGIMIIR